MNGDRLDVRVVAAPGSRENRLVMTEIEAGIVSPSLNADDSKTLPTTRGDSGQCGICNTDDRTPSTETWSGRIMPVGCSGSVICEDSTIISAGHCAGSGQVIQFNVPASTGGLYALAFSFVRSSFRGRSTSCECRCTKCAPLMRAHPGTLGAVTTCGVAR